MEMTFENGILIVERLQINAILVAFGFIASVGGGFAYNAIINLIGRKIYVITWKWVCIGVLLVLISLLVFVHWLVAAAVALFMVAWGLGLIWGDERRETDAVRSQNMFLQTRKQRPRGNR